MSDSKKGIPWLRDRLKERGEQSGSGWTETTRATHEFKGGFTARLVQRDTDKRGKLEQLYGDDHAGARETLNNATLLELMSIRITARDRKHRGKLVESWVRAATLQRIILRTSPNRDGIGHSHYTVAMALLCRERIAQPLPSGRDGYMWTDEHRQVISRAEWLVSFVRRAGEFRKLTGPQRFEILD